MKIAKKAKKVGNPKSSLRANHLNMFFSSYSWQISHFPPKMVSNDPQWNSASNGTPLLGRFSILTEKTWKNIPTWLPWLPTWGPKFFFSKPNDVGSQNDQHQKLGLESHVSFWKYLLSMFLVVLPSLPKVILQFGNRDNTKWVSWRVFRDWQRVDKLQNLNRSYCLLTKCQ